MQSSFNMNCSYIFKFTYFYLLLEPVDRPTVLLIASTQNILATYLNGAPVPTINPTSTKQTTAMDFNYAEETVCWIHMGDSPSQTTLNCAKIPNLKGFVEERTINISLSLHRKYASWGPLCLLCISE